MESWIEFEALKTMTGPSYIERRNEVLRSTPNLVDRLLGHEKEADWRNVIQAKILLGWTTHRTLYENLQRELDAEDPKAAAKTVPGLNLIYGKYAKRAGLDLKEDILPLCWEVLLKQAEQLPEWKIVTYLRMVEAVPHPLSLEPLLAYIESTPDYSLRRSAAQALAALPRKVIEGRVEQERSKHTEIADVLGVALREAR